MFKLPRLPYTRSLSSLEMTKFYGYDHTESCADGFIYDCKNISSKDFPYLTVRDKRYYIKSKDGNKIIGMSCSDELYYVTNDGQKSYFFYGDRLCGEWEDTKGSQKSFAEFGRTIYIYPDKKYFRKRDDKKCEEYLKEHPKVGQQGYVWCYIKTLSNPFAFENTNLITIGSNPGEDNQNVFEDGDFITVWGINKNTQDKCTIFDIPLGAVYSNNGNLYMYRHSFTNDNNIESYYGNSHYYYKMYFEYVYPEDYTERFGEFASDITATTVYRDEEYDYLLSEVPENKATNFYYEYIYNRYSDGMYVTVGDLQMYLISVEVSGMGAYEANYYRAVFKFPKNSLNYKTYDMILDSGMSETCYYKGGESIKISRSLPNLENICVNNNRVWGYEGNTIYASSLGKPYEMGTYKGIASDSYALEVNMKDEFSGCTSYNSMPIFFTEDRIIKIYGTDPSSFQTSETLCSGLKKGTKNSFCVCGGILYYLDATGQICAYTGSYPSVISKKLCDQYKNAVMCAVDDKIYFGLENLSGKKEMFVFDTTNGIWLKHDDKSVLLMSCFENKLYFVEDGSEMIITDKECDTFGTGVLFESDIDAFIEFPQTYDGVFNHKSLRRLILKIDAQEGCTIKVQIRYDNDELWTDVFEKCIEKGEGLLRVPIMPKRCTRYSIRISGKGKWRLEGILKELSIGSK